MKRTREEDDGKAATRKPDVTTFGEEMRARDSRALLHESPQHAAVRHALEEFITRTVQADYERDDLTAIIASDIERVVSEFFERNDVPLPPGVPSFGMSYFARYAKAQSYRMIADQGRAAEHEPADLVFLWAGGPLDPLETIALGTLVLEQLYWVLEAALFGPPAPAAAPAAAAAAAPPAAAPPAAAAPPPPRLVRINLVSSEEEEEEKIASQEEEEAISTSDDSVLNPLPSPMREAENEEAEAGEEAASDYDMLRALDAFYYEYEDTDLGGVPADVFEPLMTEWRGDAFREAFDKLMFDQQLYVLLLVAKRLASEADMTERNAFVDEMLPHIFVERRRSSSSNSNDSTMKTRLAEWTRLYAPFKKMLAAYEQEKEEAKEIGRAEPTFPEFPDDDATQAAIERLITLCFRLPDVATTSGDGSAGLPWEWRRYESEQFDADLYASTGQTLFRNHNVASHVVGEQRLYLDSMRVMPAPLITDNVTTTALLPGNDALSCCWMLPALRVRPPGQGFGAGKPEDPEERVDMLQEAGLTAPVGSILTSDADRRIMAKVGHLVEAAGAAKTLPLEYAHGDEVQAHFRRAVAAMQLFVAYDQPVTPELPSVPYSHVMMHEPLLYPRTLAARPFGAFDEEEERLLYLEEVAALAGSANVVRLMEREVTLTLFMPYLFYLRLYRHVDTLAVTRVTNSMFKPAAPQFRVLHGALSPTLILSDILLKPKGGLRGSGLGHLVFRHLERTIVRAGVHSGYLINYVHFDSLHAMSGRPGYLELSRNATVTYTEAPQSSHATWSTGALLAPKIKASTLYPPDLGAESSGAFNGHWIWLTPSARFVAVVRELRRVVAAPSQSRRRNKDDDNDDDDDTLLATLRFVEEAFDPRSIAALKRNGNVTVTLAFPPELGGLEATVTLGVRADTTARAARDVYRTSGTADVKPPLVVQAGNEDEGEEGPYAMVIDGVTFDDEEEEEESSPFHALLTHCIVVFASDLAQLWARSLVVSRSVWDAIDLHTRPLKETVGGFACLHALLIYDYVLDSPDATGSIRHYGRFIEGDHVLLTSEDAYVLMPHMRTHYTHYLPEKEPTPEKKQKKKMENPTQRKKKWASDDEEGEEEESSEDSDFMQCRYCQAETQSVFCSEACLHAHYGNRLV